MPAFPDPPYTTVAKTPVSREKPYLYVDGSGKYFVRVPSAHKDTSGTSWSGGLTPGRSIPLSDFFIARPGDSAKDDRQRPRPRPEPAVHAGRLPASTARWT